MPEKIENVKCPICGSDNVIRKSDETAQCRVCLLVAFISQFKPTRMQQ